MMLAKPHILHRVQNRNIFLYQIAMFTAAFFLIVEVFYLEGCKLCLLYLTAHWLRLPFANFHVKILFIPC
jgi:hypothetical protein